MLSRFQYSLDAEIHNVMLFILFLNYLSEQKNISVFHSLLTIAIETSFKPEMFFIYFSSEIISIRVDLLFHFLEKCKKS